MNNNKLILRFWISSFNQIVVGIRLLIKVKNQIILGPFGLKRKPSKITKKSNYKNVRVTLKKVYRNPPKRNTPPSILINRTFLTP